MRTLVLGVFLSCFLLGRETTKDALILSAYLRTWCVLIFLSSTKRYFETCVPARTREAVMSKWTMLAVTVLSVSAGIFLLCSVSSLIRDFEDAFRYED